MWYYIQAFERSAYAPVAQLDRVTDYESVGRGFESLLAYQKAGCASAQPAFCICRRKDANGDIRVASGRLDYPLFCEAKRKRVPSGGRDHRAGEGFAEDKTRTSPFRCRAWAHSPSKASESRDAHRVSRLFRLVNPARSAGRRADGRRRPGPGRRSGDRVRRPSSPSGPSQRSRA